MFVFDFSSENEIIRIYTFGRVRRYTIMTGLAHIRRGSTVAQPFCL